MIIVHATNNLLYREEDIIYLRFKTRADFERTIEQVFVKGKKHYLYFIKIVEVKEN